MWSEIGFASNKISRYRSRRASVSIIVVPRRFPNCFARYRLEQPVLEPSEALVAQIAAEGLTHVQFEEILAVVTDRTVDAHFKEEDVRRTVASTIIASLRRVAVASPERVRSILGVQVAWLVCKLDLSPLGAALAGQQAFGRAHLPFEVRAAVVYGGPEERQDVHICLDASFRVPVVAPLPAEPVDGLVEAEHRWCWLRKVRPDPTFGRPAVAPPKLAVVAFVPVSLAIYAGLRVAKEPLALVKPARRHIGPTHAPAISTPNFSEATRRLHEQCVAFGG